MYVIPKLPSQPLFSHTILTKRRHFYEHAHAMFSAILLRMRTTHGARLGYIIAIGRYVMTKVMMAFAARLKVQHVRASYYCRSVLLFRSPALVYKLRILHRLCSVSPPPVLCIPGLSRRPRPLPYILGGIIKDLSTHSSKIAPFFRYPGCTVV